MHNVIVAAFLILTTVCSCGCFKSKSTEPPVAPPPDTEEEYDGDPDIGDLSQPGTFYDKFEGALDTDKWDNLTQLWGQPAIAQYQHGGVIKENVYTRGGYAVMRALGDLYTGPLRGAGGQSTRMGGVISSRQRFASGRYEAKIMVLQAPDMGVTSASWTFWYKEITQSAYPQAWEKAIAAGNIPVNNTIALNHEIDIEVKGVKLSNPIYTNWIGEKDAEHNTTAVVYPNGLADNKFHIFRWDWHTGGNGQEPRVEYYIDDMLVHTSKMQVPYISSKWFLGNWFAWWAGNDTGTYKAPAFESKEMFVDWVKFTPFNEPNDDTME